MTTDVTTKEKKPGWRNIMRFAFHYWRPNALLGVTGTALMLLSVVMDAILPVYTGKIIDALTQKQNSDAEAWRMVWAAFTVFALLAFANQAFRLLAMAFWNRFAVRNLYAIVTEGLRKVQRFSADWHANSFAGGTVRKITRGMWSFDTFEDTLMMGLMPAVVIMTGVTIMLTLSLPTVGIAASVMILAYCAISIFLSVKVLAPRFRQSADADTKVGATLADIITGNATVKSFGTERREDAIFEEVAQVCRSRSLHAWNTSIGADAIRSFLNLFMMASMIAATIYLWRDGRATPGDIVLVMTTFFIIGGYLRDIGMNITHLQRSVSEMEDAVNFWLRQDDVVDVKNAQPLRVRHDLGKTRADMIVFDKVGFSYPNNADRKIYQDLSISIRAGEKLALVGPSGSGKSTFVKLIQRLYNVTDGAIFIDGQNITEVTLESLRQSVALVPQDPILFHRSLSDNIAYGRPGATQEEIVEAAKKAFAHDFIETLPQGYGTLVGERGVKLSGGERQRLAIARAILRDSPLLILDEATSALDTESERIVQLALANLMKNRTTLVIAHRLSTIQNADRIVVLDRGAIVEMGSHDELLRQGGVYRRLHAMQFQDVTSV